MTTTIEKYLQRISKEDCKDIFLSEFETCKTKVYNDFISAECNTEYTCKENKCDFTKAKEDVLKSKELQSTKPVVLKFIEEIEKNPQDYIPEIYDGFIFRRKDFEVFYMKRKGSKQNGYTGTIDYNDIKRSVIYKKTEKQYKDEFILMAKSCSIS